MLNQKHHNLESDEFNYVSQNDLNCVSSSMLSVLISSFFSHNVVDKIFYYLSCRKSRVRNFNPMKANGAFGKHLGPERSTVRNELMGCAQSLSHQKTH